MSKHEIGTEELPDIGYHTMRNLICVCEGNFALMEVGQYRLTEDTLLDVLS